MSDNLYSLEYENGGKLWSITMYGSEGEANQHSDNLGLGEPQLIIEQFEFDFEVVESWLN